MAPVASSTDALLQRLRPTARNSARSFGSPPRHGLFLSATDGSGRATTVNSTAATFDAAWDECSRALLAKQTEARWLRLDWIEEAAPATVALLHGILRQTKRNYFRHGIALDSELAHAFLETELNANAMLYGGNRIDHAVLNEGNFARYARRRFGLDTIDLAPDVPVWLFRTGGMFIAADEAAPVMLHSSGRNAGRRVTGPLTVAQLDGLIAAGADYLARQSGPDGRFDYGNHPCFDRPIPAYNSLRHASTLYAMLEAWEVSPSPALQDAIERGIAYLTGQLIRRIEADGRAMAFVVEEDGEIKLGASGVCLLALVKYSQLLDGQRHRALLDELGEGILHMQDPASGSFVHVLQFPSLAIKQRFRIIYYDGEAAFGLMRLHDLTGDPRWLAAVELAFGHFLRQRHWQAHDHWLGYCVNELTAHCPTEAYFRFGLRNVRSHLDFALERITTFPTLLELISATEALVARLCDLPQLRHLLREIEVDSLYEALHFRAHYLLNGHFWPELAMFFARPDKIAGSFFIRHHAFRVRIDDVEHYLSGLVGYRRFLLARGAQRPADPAQLEWRDRRETGWNARNLPLATGGAWHSRPPAKWKASGVYIHRGDFQPGRMAAVRLAENERGVPPEALLADPVRPAAALCSDPSRLPIDLPALWVESPQQAITDMARYARARFTGRVVGVTGSAGKTTTVAMMAHAMRPFGLVGQTGSNANLPLGVAWNLASMRWTDPHVVLELAVGRMAQSAALARPDVAIFTNILPAHLEFHTSLTEIARRKSRMFLGMNRGAVAVLNRGMDEWEFVHAAASARGLRISHYGRSADCDCRLLGYDPDNGEVTADIHGIRLRYRLGAAGEHMALNSLAVIAAARALGHELAPVLDQLATFQPVAGRGVQSRVSIDGKPIVLIDDSYNANPGSMQAALALLGHADTAGRRVVVLGEMAELGSDAETYHTALVPLIKQHRIDHVHALGPLYAKFWAELPHNLRGTYARSLPELEAGIRASLKPGDSLLMKGAHSTGIWKLVSNLQTCSR